MAFLRARLGSPAPAWRPAGATHISSEQPTPRAPGELRRDPLSGRLVVVAPGRAARPGAFRLPSGPDDDPADCPFCAGREHRTPPEVFALGPPERRRDSPGWSVRIVPNLYPAFERHEVVVHTPRHVRSLSELTEDEIANVTEAWSARGCELRANGASYVHVSVNEGQAAGASLPHAHSQLVALPDEPPAIAAERASGACVLCELLAAERADGTRVVLERDGVALVAARAGRLPYELLAAPVGHEPDALRSPSLATALSLVADGLRRLFTLEGRVPLNAWIHDGGHWHVEVVPRLTVFAGLELGAGIYVNTLAPEEAAERLRSAGAR